MGGLGDLVLFYLVGFCRDFGFGFDFNFCFGWVSDFVFSELVVSRVGLLFVVVLIDA